LVPEVAFWGFWGLVCIEKWSQNFDSDTKNGTSGMSSRKKTTLRGNNSHVAKQPIMASLTNSKKGHDWLLGNVGKKSHIKSFFSLEDIP